MISGLFSQFSNENSHVHDLPFKLLAKMGACMNSHGLVPSRPFHVPPLKRLSGNMQTGLFWVCWVSHFLTKALRSEIKCTGMQIGASHHSILNGWYFELFQTAKPKSWAPELLWEWIFANLVPESKRTPQVGAGRVLLWQAWGDFDHSEVIFF